MQPAPLKSPIAQRGVVLPLSLVILVMVTMIAITAIRGVTTEERIAANLRSAALGFEQSELGLRHCEAIVLAGGQPLVDTRFNSPDALGVQWKTSSSWSDARVQQPPATHVPAGIPTPRCMIEEALGAPDPFITQYRSGTRPALYTVTSRGFGDPGQSFVTTIQSQLRPNPLGP
jgi:type IV pilus assembly protein PilX